MKANKWMSMVLAMALAAGSGVTAYAAEVDAPADPTAPAEQQPAEETPTIEIVEDMMEQLEQEIADEDHDSAADETLAEESTGDEALPDDEALAGETGTDTDQAEEAEEAPAEKEDEMETLPDQPAEKPEHSHGGSGQKEERAAARQERLARRDAKIELARQNREARLAAKEARIALLDRLKELHALLEGQEMNDQDELVIELRAIQEQIKAYRQSR